MHFWIDKRSSYLYNSHGGGGRGRIAGPGGFYSRTFGNRHHHPPPLLRSQSSINSSSNNPNSSTSVNQSHLRALNSNTSHHNGHNNPNTTTVPGQNHVSPSSAMPSNNQHYNSYHQNPHLSMNPMDNMNGGNFPPSGNHFGMFPPSQGHQQNTTLMHGMRHMGGPQGVMDSFVMAPMTHISGGGGGRGNPNEIMNYTTVGSADPVIGLSGGGMGSSGVGRRPRSHSHSASGPGPPNRRRSSSSGAVNFNQRRSSVNRWTYDPYNISHHQQIRHSHQAPMWPDGRQAFMENNSNNLDSSPNGIINAPRFSSDLLSSDLEVNSRQAQALGTSTTSTSTHSIVDPAWKRTKRIGLTLCFMAFILLSTVAAKFVIEGPWLIDKTPRNERTEATIYFFLTEVIFIIFAMALFFAGVTCLRKRTNAYLLRQFNDYIMQTSPQVGGGLITPEYFGRGSTHGENPAGSISSHQTSHMGGMNPNPNNNTASDRPFSGGPNFLPSFENHLMNMHISVAESSNYVMSGLTKPPPYHIALYLPVPDEQCQITPGAKESTPENNHKLRLSQNSQASSWISSCLTDNDDDGNKTGEDSDDHNDELDVDGNTDVEGRKKRRINGGKADPEDRSETPPPPYGQH